jgi:hypothetical protein
MAVTVLPAGTISSTKTKAAAIPALISPVPVLTEVHQNALAWVNYVNQALSAPTMAMKNEAVASANFASTAPAWAVT